VGRDIFTFTTSSITCSSLHTAADFSRQIHAFLGFFFPPPLPRNKAINPLNVELNPICHLLPLLGAHHILHVSRARVKYYYRTTPCQPYFLSLLLVHVYKHINATYLRAGIFQLVQWLDAVYDRKSIPGKITSPFEATFSLAMELMHPPTQRVNGVKLAGKEARLLW